MEIRDLTPDDLDGVLDIRKRSFGVLSAADREQWRKTVLPQLEAGRYLGAFDGARIAAAARLRGFTQWWHGRPQPMAGVAGVTVNPEDRGRGIGGQIMRAVIERAAELGDAVSALYPATTPIYRGLGYEHAGAQLRVTIPADALRAIRASNQVKLRRMGPDDAPELIALLGRLHAASHASGPISWDEHTWRLWLQEEDDFLYLADDGFVVYRWDGSDLEVDNLVAGSPDTAAALWSLVGSSSSIAKNVVACLAPDDPVLWMLRERTRDAVTPVRWMFRIVDVPSAIARRGFPAGVTLDTVVEVVDPVRQANTGAWHLTVSDGVGTATPSSEQGTRLTLNGLSALYAGVPTATLRVAGMLSGPADEALDAAFAAKPYMLDYF
ncbi:enhanced intracellular survival protein Eis [Nonomuraea sp. NPDC050556]|uniref:enhanced intracellular survival protein Eis n=1 Tax=Nonomuraea sp. NPDC050556 TaxID=3364369 RepID=UPI0037A0162A